MILWSSQRTGEEGPACQALQSASIVSGVKMTLEELEKRLAEADRRRLTLLQPLRESPGPRRSGIPSRAQRR
jgi:hypothetical protein